MRVSAGESPGASHPRPASLTRSVRAPSRSQLSVLVRATLAHRARARRRVSHAASSTLFPANPPPGVSLRPRATNLAPARLSGPQLLGIRHPRKETQSPAGSSAGTVRDADETVRTTLASRASRASRRRRHPSSRSRASLVAVVRRCSRASPGHASPSSRSVRTRRRLASRPRLTRRPPGVRRCVLHSGFAAALEVCCLGAVVLGSGSPPYPLPPRL